VKIEIGLSTSTICLRSRLEPQVYGSGGSLALFRYSKSGRSISGGELKSITNDALMYNGNVGRCW